MSCRFDHCLVLTWALPAPVLEPLVPPGLDLDTYDGRWGFVVIAVVQTRQLRPAFLPPWAGRDYALTGYRIFVKHRGQAARTRRGLHILRSDTDKRSMKLTCSATASSGRRPRRSRCTFVPTTSSGATAATSSWS